MLLIWFLTANVTVILYSSAAGCPTDEAKKSWRAWHPTRPKGRWFLLPALDIPSGECSLLHWYLYHALVTFSTRWFSYFKTCSTL